MAASLPLLSQFLRVREGTPKNFAASFMVRYLGISSILRKGGLGRFFNKPSRLVFRFVGRPVRRCGHCRFCPGRFPGLFLSFFQRPRFYLDFFFFFFGRAYFYSAVFPPGLWL